MGVFIKGENKIRPGEYHRVENAGGIELVGATNGVVAGIIRANWGPLNQVVIFDQAMTAKSVFGSGAGMTEDLITLMMKAGNIRGYFVRCGIGGTCGSITLTDDAVDAVNVLTITAKYVGSRAFTVSVRDSLTNTTKRECIIYDGTSEFEKFEFEKGAAGGEADALVEAIAESSNFTATKSADGSGSLASVTQSAFTAGTNPTVAVEQYSSALNELEPYVYNVVCVDTDDRDVHAVLAAFISRSYAAGSYPMAVVSETKSVSNTLPVRMARAASYDDAKMNYVLNGAIDVDGNRYEGYRNAARIGGIIAYVPADKSTTHYIVKGYSGLIETLTNTQIEAALQSGCIVLTTDSSGAVWIEQGINTLIHPSDDEDKGWKKIRRVKTRFELMNRVGGTCAQLVGKVNNDPDGRAAVVAAGQAIIDEMIAEKKILIGSAMMEDELNPAQGESAWFILAIDDIDSIEKFYLTYRFRFTANN